MHIRREKALALGGQTSSGDDAQSGASAVGVNEAGPEAAPPTKLESSTAPAVSAIEENKVANIKLLMTTLQDLARLSCGRPAMREPPHIQQMNVCSKELQRSSILWLEQQDGSYTET